MRAHSHERAHELTDALDHHLVQTIGNVELPQSAFLSILSTK
jgi:hypothetical protein